MLPGAAAERGLGGAFPRRALLSRDKPPRPFGAEGLPAGLAELLGPAWLLAPAPSRARAASSSGGAALVGGADEGALQYV